MTALATFLAGAAVGFGLTLALSAGAGMDGSLSDWVAVNLGSSTWLFSACLLAFLGTLTGLKNRLETDADYETVFQLDQLGDVLIHVFIGIGVIWTAIGMRNALVTTLSVPAELGDSAEHLLGRLVDGGILLALSTTIVGAVGGYLMRLTKTVSIGTPLTAYYRRQSSEPLDNALARLANIERLLESFSRDGKRAE